MSSATGREMGFWGSVGRKDARGFWRVNCLEHKGSLTGPRWGYLRCQLHAGMLWAPCSCWLLKTMPVYRGAVWNKSPRSGAQPCRGSAFLHRNISVVRPVTRISRYPSLKNCLTRNGFLYIQKCIMLHVLSN